MTTQVSAESTAVSAEVAVSIETNDGDNRETAMDSNVGMVEPTSESKDVVEPSVSLRESISFQSGAAQEGGARAAQTGAAYRLYPHRADRVLTFDLHPLYASILVDGAVARQGEVLGLDGDLRQALVAPFDGTIRLLVTGTGAERRVKVFLTEQRDRRDHFAGRL